LSLSPGAHQGKWARIFLEIVQALFQRFLYLLMDRWEKYRGAIHWKCHDKTGKSKVVY
jgi:hypothetical protein